ncbi:cysteine desulfurase family protein [Candidatus Poriferisodalis sp.]|uniref:cysteine desulfurase family protein n=1 Tax=Candidatus Poriferisodalis sp. TaxID=3101277 RepID=UPI003B012E5F
MNEIYLDYNASAPCDPRVTEAVTKAMTDGFGNASSVHRFGLRQAAAVDEARQHVAALVGGRPAGVIFTSGATEANNLALGGLVASDAETWGPRTPSLVTPEAEAPGPLAPRLVISTVEHASVSRTAESLAAAGRCELERAPVTPGGFVDLEALAAMLQPVGRVLLVSIMAANSETGVLNPIAEIADLVHRAGGRFHCDATQMIGRLPFDMSALGCDLVSLSGHKMCGPTGVGALVGTRQTLASMRPIGWGGGHERGLRSGSLNVAGIVGLGVAAELAAREQAAEAQAVGALRDRFVGALQRQLADVAQNGDVGRRLPNTANLRFRRADADAVMANLDPVAVSTGSACSAGAVEPSPALTAMGMSREAAFESLRFSLGRFTTAADINAAVGKVVTAVRYVRSMTTEAA